MCYSCNAKENIVFLLSLKQHHHQLRARSRLQSVETKNPASVNINGQNKLHFCRCPRAYHLSSPCSRRRNMAGLDAHTRSVSYPGTLAKNAFQNEKKTQFVRNRVPLMALCVCRKTAWKCRPINYAFFFCCWGFNSPRSFIAWARNDYTLSAHAVT